MNSAAVNRQRGGLLPVEQLPPSQAVVCSLAVVGEKEKMTNSVNVRTRDNKIHGELSAAEVLARLTLLKQSRCPNAEEEF